MGELTTPFRSISTLRILAGRQPPLSFRLSTLRVPGPSVLVTTRPDGVTRDVSRMLRRRVYWEVAVLREGRGSSAGPLRTLCGRFFLAGAPANGTLVPVSSMKTSCLVSIEGCLSRHSLRAALTSSRSCSAACSVSFKADPVTIEEAPQSRNAGREGFVRNQTPADFHQRQVRLLGDQREQPIFCAPRSTASAGHRRLGWPTSHQFAGSAAERIADTDFEHRARAPA